MVGLTYTPIEEIEKIRNDLKASVQSGKLRSIAYRKTQLLQLAYLVHDNVQRFQEALASDLGRPKIESNFLEINITISECKHAYENVSKWAKPESPPFSVNFFAVRPVIRKEAKGTVLIISPFNFPLFLSLGPVAGAIAAGNTVVLKPSEISPAVSALMTELVPQYLDNDVFRIVNGAVPETTKLLELQWDHILYTGGNAIAKIVSAAAAKHLTPVSLELGGKSPVVVDPGCDLKTAARRILWGKTINAGQTCVAPDYVLVPKEFQDKFIEALKETHDSFYPEGPAKSDSFSRLVSPRHFARVKGLLDNTNGTVVIGGETDSDSKYIAPTVVKDVKSDDSLMSEELFGPILPIVPVDDVDEAIKFINARDHPLALYVFSTDAAFKNKVFDNTQSGAAVANECVLHTGTDGLPFGGTGQSGSGYHTGKFSFDMFTHLRGSIDSPSWMDVVLGSRFPPYNESKEKALNKITFPSLPSRPSKRPGGSEMQVKWWGPALLTLALAMSAVLTKRRSLLPYLPGWLSSYL
jgi:aldehyde dehydrogenase (NAD+)/aldehyde dehydrogenase (NAD(P)+)